MLPMFLFLFFVGIVIILKTKLPQGCHQIARAISIPPVAVLSGLLLTVSFCMSHSSVKIEATEWVEPVILWLSICMPTGSGKTPLFKLLKGLIDKTRMRCGLTLADRSWCLDNQSFEKMGSLMADNHGKLIVLYDELTMFLFQINVFRGRGISDSHELAVFLQLYGGSSWIRRTGMYAVNFFLLI